MAIKRHWALAALAMTVAASPTDAAWMRATSQHFIVYADGRESDIRETAMRLEQFDGVLRHLQHVPATTDKPSNRVTVFVADNVAAVERLCGCNNIAGFYLPRASGSVAFTPHRGDGGGPDAMKPQIVLFHEYAHHFLLGNAPFAYPAWYSEGYAEFVSTTTFDKDFAQVGVAAQHRASSLFYGPGLSIKRMFARGGTLSDDQTVTLYGRGWLLTHYLVFDKDHGAAFHRYLQLLNSGTPSLAAAEQSFGDLKKLDRDLDRYLLQSHIPGMKVALAILPPSVVDVRRLTAGESAMIDLRMVSTRGVNGKTAQPLYEKARRIVSAYPNDAVAQGWFAEIAADAGRNDEAEAAADRALAADPQSVQAMLYKARIGLRRAVAAESTDPKVWADARSWIVRANHIDNDDAALLSLYYYSFEMQHVAPRASAIEGLYRAFELVPQDPGLRLSMVRQAVRDGDLALARQSLRPLAYDPHQAEDNPAAQLLAVLDAAPTAEAARQAMQKLEPASDDAAGAQSSVRFP